MINCPRCGYVQPPAPPADLPTDSKCWLLYHGDGLSLAEITKVLGLVGTRSPARRIRSLDRNIFGTSDITAEDCEYIPESYQNASRHGFPRMFKPADDDHSYRAEWIRTHGFDLDDP